MEEDQLKKKKNQKAAADTLNDLEQVRIIIDVAFYGLKKYKKYKLVNWLITDLTNNLSLVDTYIKKCKQVIEETKK